MPAARVSAPTAAAGSISPPWDGTCTSETTLTRSSSIASSAATSTPPAGSSGIHSTVAPVRSATWRSAM